MGERELEEGLPEFEEHSAADLPPDAGDVGELVPPPPDDVEPPVVRGGGGAGLTPDQRVWARRVVLRAARLLLARPDSLHYTQDARRWDGIANQRRVRERQIPSHGDCSSTATWMLWNALFTRLGMDDVVNGQGWRGGFTGTMLEHGKAVSAGSARVGDLVIYGPAAPGRHVAVCIGKGMVLSHGSEAGPFKLAMRYRDDVLSVRRYF